MRDSMRHFSVKIATTDEELRAAQALRYDVFVRELGSDGDLVDHDAGLERDRFDPFFDHLLLTDETIGKVVGLYRIMRFDQAEQMGQFYSEDEYDLTALRTCGRKVLELGRSCLHRDYRGGMAMYHLWNGLAQYVSRHEIDVLFGVASFHGTDVSALTQPMGLLHYDKLAPIELRVRSKEFQPMDLIDESALDRRKAMAEMPALIKAYLRLGGCVGEGAFVDYKFNTTDVCLILDTARMNERQGRLYKQGRAST